MLFKDIIELPTISYVQDDIGDTIETKTWKNVFANKKDVRQSEFYQAMATGIKPTFMFEISEHDYKKEEILRFEDVELRIIRTHEIKNERIEIVCEGTVI